MKQFVFGGGSRCLFATWQAVCHAEVNPAQAPAAEPVTLMFSIARSHQQ